VLRRDNAKPEYLGCWRKKPYTRRQAHAKIERERAAGVTLFLYRCPYDTEHRRHHWHVTRKSPPAPTAETQP